MNRLKQLMQKREALNTRIHEEESRLRAAAQKIDTRRKVLAGATVLEWAKRDNDFSARLYAELNAFLVRDADRLLFDLPPQEARAMTRALKPV